MYLAHVVADQADRNQLLLQRVEQAAWLVLFGLPVFYVVDLLRGAELVGSLGRLKVLAAVLAWTTVYVVRREAMLVWARLIALQAFAAFCFLTAASGIISRDALTTPMLCSAVTFSAGALFPWGVRAQWGALIVAAAAIVWNRLQVIGSFGGDAAYPLTAIAVAMAASLAWAAAAERQLTGDTHPTEAQWAPHRRTMLDLVGAVSLAALTYVLASRLDSFEMLRPWMASQDDRNLGAIALTVVLGIGLMWFAYRRMRETATELEARWQAERALAEAQARLQAAVVSSKVGVWDWDLQTGVTHYSDSWRTLFGYTPAEVDGSQEAWAKLVHPDDLARLVGSTAAATAIADPTTPYEEEFRLRHKDGTYRWVLSRATVFCDARGTVQRMIGAHVDISEHKRLSAELAALNRELERRVAERTGELEVINEDLRREIAERNKAEQELRESEDRYRDLVEHSEDLVTTHDLQGRMLSVNPIAAKLLEYEQSDLVKMNVREVLAPEVRERFGDYLTTIRRDGIAKGLMRVQTRTGKRLIWEYNNTLRTEGVAAPIVRGMAHDITARKHAEDALRASEERFRALVQDASNAICVVDGRLLIQYASPAMERLGGLRLSELIGTLATQYVHPDDVAALCSGFANVPPGVPYRAEHRLRHADGSWVYVETTGTTHLDDPAIRGTVLNVRDMSDRKRLDQQRADFVAMLAHDIRSPLANIAGYTEMLLETGGLPSAARELLSASQRSVQTLLSLVTNYLQHAQIEAGRFVLTKQPLILNELLDRVCRQYHSECARRHLAMELRLQPGLPQVDGDPVALERVFTNLVQNALKFTPDAGHIAIESGQEGPNVTVSVTDSGSGIAANELPNLFTRYRQATGGRARGGMGLGLFIVRSVVEAHGGTVEVASAPGSGSRFTVRLPDHRLEC